MNENSLTSLHSFSGVELKLELYDPRLQKIEVLRLEKRLDTHLRYLRDAPPEYSTFPLDMKAEIRRTDEVPINRIKVCVLYFTLVQYVIGLNYQTTLFY